MEEYAHPYIKEEGNLYIPTSNRGGKKFQTWTFKPVNGERFEIEINLLYPRDEKPLRFSAHSGHLSQSYESSDIEELRKMVDADLQNSCSLLNNIVWEEWYEVIVSCGYKERHPSAAMKIEYGKLKKGIHPETGAEVTIHNNKVVLPFPKAKRSGDKDKESFSRHSDSDEVSYVPVTPENTQALESLVEKLGMLREEVAGFLSQNNITRSLESVDKQLLIE